MKNLVKHPLIHLASIIIAFHAAATRADSTAVAFDTTQYWGLSTGTGVYGWEFAAQSSLEVSSLGLYDNANVGEEPPPATVFPGDGLLESHDIGIWDVSNPSSPLVSAIIPAGQAAPLENGFRYVSISPLELLAGHDYVIAATYIEKPSGEDWMTGPLNNTGFVLTVAPDINILGYSYGNSSTLTYPGGLESGVSYAVFGPNFTYTVVPEPTTLTLTGLAAAMIFSSSKALRRAKK